jgi:hypothetical protein
MSGASTATRTMTAMMTNETHGSRPRSPRGLGRSDSSVVVEAKPASIRSSTRAI